MSTKKQRQYVARRLADAGFNATAIAGIMANIAHESSFNPNATNPSSGAYGIAQWLGSRKSALQAFARSRGKSASDLDTQIDFLVKETKQGQSGPTGTVTIETLNRQKTPEAAATFWNRNWERSDDTTGQRAQTARKMIGMTRKVAKGGGSSAQGESTPKVPGSSGGTMTWVPKVGSEVSNPYGAANSRYAAGHHTGADIPGNSGGQPIRWAPPMGGKVVKRGTSGAYGNHMIIRDEKGREWLLAHMQSEPLKVGTRVSQGDRIGTVGNTGSSDGAHLHIEMTEPLKKGEHWSYGQNVKKPKLVFKVGPDGQVYDKDFKPTTDEFMDQVGLSGEALDREGNEALRKLVDQAVAEEWTAQEFTRRFKATKWYRRRAESQRTFDMLQDTDQQQQIAQAQADARVTAERMGVTLNDKQLRRLAVLKARDGFNDQQVQWWIGRRYKGDGDQSGIALATQESLKTYARDFGVRLDTSTMNKWTQEVLQSGKDVSSYVDNIRDIAAQQNPYLRDAYSRGLTTREALQSYIGTAAQLMGKSEDDIDLSDPKWRKVFDANGNALTDAQWRTQIKSQAEYGYGNTQNAINEARMHGRNLLRTMGAFSG